MKRDPADARAAFLAYWNAHGRTHFRLEEEILLPAYAGYGDCRHPLIERALPARALSDVAEALNAAGG